MMSHYVEPLTALDKEAEKRATSVLPAGSCAAHAAGEDIQRAVLAAAA